MNCPQSFIDGYITTALWSSCDENEVPLDENYSPGDICAETLDRMYADCSSFWEGNSEDLLTSDPENSGVDFWLTRNRHGTGFWDREELGGGVGERLSSRAYDFGECYLFVRGNGKIDDGR